MTSQGEVLHIPIPVEALRITLGDRLVDEALGLGQARAEDAKLLGDRNIEYQRAVAAGFLTVDVTRRLRVADVYSRRLEVAVGLMPRDVRNRYEAAISSAAAGNVVSLRRGDAA